MTQDIHYKGYTAVPSDHDCEDGTLAASVDMIYEDGALRPLLPQKQVANIGSTRPLFVHRNGDIDNLILMSSDGKLQYIDRSGGAWPNPTDIDVKIEEAVISVNALGNTLMVFTEGPIYYILWKDNAYSFLGNNLPDLQLSFGLVGHPRLYSQCYDENSDDKEKYGRFNVGTFESTALGDEFVPSAKSVVTSEVMAKLNKIIAEQATNKGRFCHPFFVRYAYRLFDGSLVCHSTPVLMFPGTNSPIVFAYNNEKYAEGTWDAKPDHFWGDIFLVTADLDFAPLEQSILNDLKKWSDIITSVDIFVSKPIYPYDQSGQVETCLPSYDSELGKQCSSSKFVGRLQCEGVSKSFRSTGDAATSSEPFNTIPIAEYDKLCGLFNESFEYKSINEGYAEWSYMDLFRLFFTTTRAEPIYRCPLPDFEDEQNNMLYTIKDTAQYYLLKSYELSEITGMSTGNRTVIEIKDDYLQSLVNREVMTDDYLSRDKMHASLSYGYNSRVNLSGVKRQPCIGFLPHCQFGFVNSIYTVDWHYLNLDLVQLDNKYYPVAKFSWCNTSRSANSPFGLTVYGVENNTSWCVKKEESYNLLLGFFGEQNRDNAYDTTYVLQKTGDTQSKFITEIQSYTAGSNTLTTTTITREPGTSDETTNTVTTTLTNTPTETYTITTIKYWSYKEYLVIRQTKKDVKRTDSMCWFFYPNTNATKIVLQCGADKYYTIPLKKHDFLNGAYALLDFGAVREPETTKPDGLDNALTDASKEFPISAPNKIYTSEVGNPFYFPVLNIYTVGAGNILNICAATKAMSQGQFGQFPLYAFTDEGVYALEVSSTGTFAAKQPITRDICLSADGIASLDSAVLFPTQRGILLLSGSNAISITDTVCSEYPTDITVLPGFDTLHKMLGHADADSCFPTKPFQEYMSGSRIIYDYVHQRVWIYNPDYTYTYVYSLRSQLWGMSYQTFASHLNDYPDALAVTKDGSLLSFSTFGADEAKCLFVTRPLKLGAGSLLKSPDAVIQRGFFESGHVATALYGSRDLQHWHLVDSSKTHRLVAFRTSPFKYFRIAGIATLSGAESIAGATVQFETKLDKQIH